ncbi:MAG: electron transfer flavoprotein subunit alpha/FixB family protein [Solirubrobacteraceae bacterium]
MSVLVFMEAADDELSLQALTFARQLPGADDGLRAVQIQGQYAPAAWGQTLANLVAESSPAAVVAPGSDRGTEVLAHTAAILDLPMSANTLSVSAGAEALITRVRWGGSLLEQARLHGQPMLLTVAAHSVPAATEVAALEMVDGTPHPLAVAPSERLAAATGGLSLEDASVVVAGGRGVGSSEGFAALEELAGLLGGVVGCSRAVTSAGWRPHTDQVGQTGTKVAPDLYIACGISGATQHMAGCKAAKRLLAINSDAEASIFANADYGVVGDLHQVIPAINAELRKVKGQ